MLHGVCTLTKAGSQLIDPISFLYTTLALDNLLIS